MIKIIAGSLAGRNIHAQHRDNSAPTVRPTTNKIRQACFNLLLHNSNIPSFTLQGAAILDICCGSGAFGFEAISRGAFHVTFFDQNISLAQKNAASLKIEAQCTFYSGTAPKALALLHNAYDLIYLDPPYANAEILNTSCDMLKYHKLVHDNSIVIIETCSKTVFDPQANWQTLLCRRYGISQIIFLKPQLQ